VTAKEQGQAIRSLLDACRGAYGATEFEPRGEDPIDEFVFSFLLWDAPEARADAAMKRIMAETSDFNDLRVSLPHEIAGILGARYPRVEERALRLRLALNEIFRRENAVSLESLRSRGKKEARDYLQTLEGAPPFVCERVALLCLGGHAAPVDERMLDALVHAGALDDAATVEDAVALLGRHIKAAEALEAHLLLQRWVEDGGAVGEGGKPVARRRTAPKSTPKKKKAAGKRASRAGSSSGGPGVKK